MFGTTHTRNDVVPFDQLSYRKQLEALILEKQIFNLRLEVHRALDDLLTYSEIQIAFVVIGFRDD